MLELLQRRFHGIAEWEIPAGGFYIWLQFTVSPLSIRQLFHTCLEQNVLIHPGYLYDRLDASHIRLSYAYASPDEMERGLQCLAEAVHRLWILDPDFDECFFLISQPKNSLDLKGPCPSDQGC